MEIFTIGFTKTSAEEFFARLKGRGIERLVDVRLNNRSQLAGFAKHEDLRYFLKVLVGATYEHEPLLAPTHEILDAYKRRDAMSWAEYERRFLELMRNRHIEKQLRLADFATKRTVLLCSEATPEHCHRRLVIEYLQQYWPGVEAVHL